MSKNESYILIVHKCGHSETLYNLKYKIAVEPMLAVTLDYYIILYMYYEII